MNSASGSEPSESSAPGHPSAPADTLPGRGGNATAGYADAAGQDGSDESTLTVLLALGANAGIGLLKLVAGLLTGSGALLSEAAHSAGDSSTELLLLTALRRSDRPADRVHPFGYGKERYFWSLLAAVAIFISGAAFSIYQGVTTIFGGAQEPHDKLWINYPVLAIAFVLEGVSFRQAVGQAKGAAASGRRSVRSYLRDPDDPTVMSVVVEDSAALVGLVLAAAGVGLHQLTGSEFWDGLASLAIGALLVVAAFSLAHTNKGLLIGKQADVRMIRAVEARLEAQPEVLDLVDVLTMMTGVHRVLLCARLDFVDGTTADEIEAACVRIDAELRAEFPSLDEIFLQPVPRGDQRLRERVLNRYGRVLADEPDRAATADPAATATSERAGEADPAATADPAAASRSTPARPAQ
ncbi:MAG TPA: cation diffusion facilitator family transporter [Jatrophihabitans sp.]|nr:cation diffusion facilitator family transporter [Jatrophihabitans sp.]